MKQPFRSKSLTQTNFNHNFIDYKVIPQKDYKKSFKNHPISKPQEQNFVYKHMRNEKIISEIFSKIFGKPKRAKTQFNEDTCNYLRIKKRNSTECSQTRLSETMVKKVNGRERENSEKRVDNFNSTLKEFHKSMYTNKKRISLLYKYNRAAKDFEESIPKDPSEETRQSIEQNHRLIKLIVEDSIPKLNKESIN